MRDTVCQLGSDIFKDFWLRIDHRVFEIVIDENLIFVAGKWFALSDFDIKPISTDVSGIVTVVPVAVDRIANVERVSATVQENSRNSVAIYPVPQVVIGIFVIDLKSKHIGPSCDGIAIEF